MRRFSYLRDPLFLICCALYAGNRWCVKPYFHVPFFRNWFSDLLLVPCALPPLLLLHRWLHLRDANDFPTAIEIGTHLIGGSVLFEWIGPEIMQHSVGDPWDVLAYTIGAVIAFVWWKRQRLTGSRVTY